MTTRLSLWIRWSIVALALLMAWGCAVPSRFRGPFRPAPTPTVEELVGPLRQRLQPVKTLRFKAQVSAWQSRRPGRLHFEALAGIEPPNQLRLRAYRSATVTIFDLLANEKGLHLHDAVNNEYYAADYATLRRADSLWAAFTPSLLVQALTVEQSILERVASARAVSVHRHWGTFELRIENADGSARFFFDRKSRDLVSLIHEGAGSQGTTRLRYGKMVEVEGVRLPQWVEVDHRPTRIRLRLEITEYKVNQSFPPGAFVLKAPAGKQWLPLETFR